MKKVKIKGKLNLDKMTNAKLNNQQTDEVVGGKGFLSIGNACTFPVGGCPPKKVTNGIWCW